ncbi:hypothetical protein [Cyanobium sp. ULC065]
MLAIGLASVIGAPLALAELRDAAAGAPAAIAPAPTAPAAPLPAPPPAVPQALTPPAPPLVPQAGSSDTSPSRYDPACSVPRPQPSPLTRCWIASSVREW